MLVVVGSSSRLNPRLNALAAVGSVSVDMVSTDGGSTALILGAVGMYIAVLAGRCRPPVKVVTVDHLNSATTFAQIV